MNEIRLFEHGEFGQLRIVERDGEHWFVAKDVCSALGLGNNRQAVSRLDEDEKRVISSDTPGGKQELQAVNEPGLYSLVLSSRKPEAKAFKRWVTHEVLPAIRKDGGYMVARDETPEETMARALLMADSTIRRQRALIADLEPRAELGEAMSAADGSRHRDRDRIGVLPPQRSRRDGEVHGRVAQLRARGGPVAPGRVHRGGGRPHDGGPGIALKRSAPTACDARS